MVICKAPLTGGYSEALSVLHMGKRNQELSYEMGGKVLKVSEEERDLGVIMHRSAKPSRQCTEASKRLIHSFIHSFRTFL